MAGAEAIDDRVIVAVEEPGVTASDDKSARVWDARTGKPVTEPLKHRDEVRTAAFSPDGTKNRAGRSIISWAALRKLLRLGTRLRWGARPAI